MTNDRCTGHVHVHVYMHVLSHHKTVAFIHEWVGKRVLNLKDLTQNRMYMYIDAA